MIGIVKYVRNTLVNNTDVYDIAGDMIFPIVSPDAIQEGQQVRFPFVVMERVSLIPTYTKGMGCSIDSVSVDVTCWDTDYDNSVDLATKIRTALEQVKGSFEDINVRDCRVEDVSEGYADNAYYQSIIFNFKQ